MPATDRQTLAHAIEAGIAACPGLTLAEIDRLRLWASVTDSFTVGQFVSDTGCHCPLSGALGYVGSDEPGDGEWERVRAFYATFDSFWLEESWPLFPDVYVY